MAREPAAVILATLRSARRRLVLWNFFRWSARCTLFILAALVAVSAASWAVGSLRLDPSTWQSLALALLILPFAMGSILGGWAALLLLPSLRRTAQVVDGMWHSRDRFVSALEFMERGGEIESLALAECAEFARAHQEVPVPAPAELRWAVVPLVMLGVFMWMGVDAGKQHVVAEMEAMREIAPALGKLESLAERLAARSEQDDVAKKIQERLKKSAEQLRAEAKAGADGRKSVLRELAALESLVKELRQPGEATAGELKTIAAALAKDAATKDAAKDIEAGEFSSAARKLEQAANDPSAAAKAAEQVQQAMQHLAEKHEQLSKQMAQLKDNAQPGTPAGEQLQQLARALDELAQKRGQQKQPGGKPVAGKPSAKPMSDEELKQLLGAIEDMKNQGDGEEQPGGEGDEKKDDSEVTVSSFASAKPGNGKGDGDPFPTGRPGGEKDDGTTKTPFGEQETTAAEGGSAAKPEGLLGEGESLSTMLPAAARGDEKAARRYRDVHKAAAAAAEDVVTQENIPLGSRFLIRRYFESIRPK